jgi:hypothetical protein
MSVSPKMRGTMSHRMEETLSWQVTENWEELPIRERL